MTSAIEQELIKATKFKTPKGGYKHRQDEIAALAKAAVRLSDDDFDELTNGAADWVNSAIKAINDKADIRDFVADDEEPEDDADIGDEDQEADEEPADDDEAGEADAEDNEEATDEADEAEDDVDHEAEEAEQAKQAIAGHRKIDVAKKVGKAAREAQANKTGKSKPKKPTKEELAAVKTRYDNLTGEKDRYGVIIGTKTHDAVLMYEKGATSKQIQEALGEGPTKAGGRFYNILRKLNEEGHLVERFRDGTFKLIHKDDLPPDRKPKEPRKTKQTRIGAR
jgi:hypothetical protein